MFLEPVSSEERRWIDTLYRPFSSHHVTSNGYEVFMLDRHYHQQFNVFASLLFYLQRTHVGEKETAFNTRADKIYYVHEPMFKPTGTLIVDQGSQIMTCREGYLHDASGEPAMMSALFGPAYYLHGQHYEAIEYFRLLEDQRKHRPEWFAYNYPEYQPHKYIEFMASVLGNKG